MRESLEKIFSKTSFPKAPGGNLYEWKTVNNAMDIGEEIEVIHSYEIEIRITDVLIL